MKLSVTRDTSDTARVRRIKELTHQYAEGLITAKEFRSSVVTIISMMDDVDTQQFASIIHWVMSLEMGIEGEFKVSP